MYSLISCDSVLKLIDPLNRGQLIIYLNPGHETRILVHLRTIVSVPDACVEQEVLVSDVPSHDQIASVINVHIHGLQSKVHGVVVDDFFWRLSYPEPVASLTFLGVHTSA